MKKQKYKTKYYLSLDIRYITEKGLNTIVIKKYQMCIELLTDMPD